MRARFLVVMIAACADKTCPPPPSCPPPSPPPLSAVVTADAAAAANPVQAEMRLLTQILEQTVAAIGARDVRPIAEQLHRLHDAKAATTAAIKDGTYKLPLNPEDVAGFLAADEAFHQHLGALVTASRSNDVPGAAAALGTLVGGCQSCHARYRP